MISSFPSLSPATSACCPCRTTPKLFSRTVSNDRTTPGELNGDINTNIPARQTGSANTTYSASITAPVLGVIVALENASPALAGSPDALATQCKPMRLRHGGFTLVELLVVIGIIAVLAALLLGGLGQIRQRANVAAEMNNLRQIGVALNLYLGDNELQYPFVGLGPPDFWNVQLSSYLPHKLTMEKQASVFQSPLVPQENRHPISDYGANMAVFRDANPGNPGRATSRLRGVTIPSPASTVAVCTAWHRPAGDRKGKWVASWFVETSTYVAAGTATSMPHPRLPSLPDPAASPNDLQGKVGALFCDGHVEQIDWKQFHPNRAKYLVP